MILDQLINRFHFIADKGGVQSAIVNVAKNLLEEKIEDEIYETLKDWTIEELLTHRWEVPDPPQNAPHGPVKRRGRPPKKVMQ